MNEVQGQVNYLAAALVNVSPNESAAPEPPKPESSMKDKIDKALRVLVSKNEKSLDYVFATLSLLTQVDSDSMWTNVYQSLVKE